jgi:hypothetical protein
VNCVRLVRSLDQLRVVGARYNRGAALSLEKNRKVPEIPGHAPSVLAAGAVS